MIQDIKDILRQEVKKDFHRTADCFVLVIMTHGTSGSIYGTDGKTVSIEEIKKQFNGENFPAMADKPKVLLIQACRGGNAAFWSVTVTAGIKIYLLFVQYIYQTHRFQSTHDTQTNSYPGQLASKKSSLLVK